MTPSIRLTTRQPAERRAMLTPPAAGPRRARRVMRLPRTACGRAVTALAVSLVVALGGTLAAAAISPGSGSPFAPAAAAQPPPNPVPVSTPPPTTAPRLPIPLGPPTSVTCFPGSLQYECQRRPT